MKKRFQLQLRLVDFVLFSCMWYFALIYGANYGFCRHCAEAIQLNLHRTFTTAVPCVLMISQIMHILKDYSGICSYVKVWGSVPQFVGLCQVFLRKKIEESCTNDICWQHWQHYGNIICFEITYSLLKDDITLQNCVFLIFGTSLYFYQSCFFIIKFLPWTLWYYLWICISKCH